MSIAVSAVIMPSRLLRLAVISYGAANLGAGFALCSGLCGPSFLPGWFAGACPLASAVLLLAYARGIKTHQIDISGVGQIRLTVQLDIGTSGAPRRLVQLMPGSTVWPQLLLLGLRDEAGTVTRLAVDADSVRDGLFRALAVAIRDISARENKFLKNKETL